MKLKFWRKSSEILFGYPFIMILSLAGCITFSILVVKHNYVWPALVFCAFLLILNIISMLIIRPNSPLTRIEVSNEEIRCTLYKHCFSQMNWNEVKEIKRAGSGFNSIIAFISTDKTITLEVNKKIYNTIISVCPRQELREMLENIEHFKWYHKNNKQKKIG